MDDAELQRIYQEGTSRRAGKPPGCPSDEALLRVLTGAASRRERQALADHLVRCSDCAEEYRVAAELQPWAAAAADRLRPVEEASRPVDSAPGAYPAAARRRRLPGFFWSRVAPASALLLLVAGAVLWPRLSPPAGPDRGGRSVLLSVQPEDRAIVREPPEVFAWSAVPNAQEYQLVLYDFESTPMWESPETTDRQVRLPAAVRDTLEPGQRYYWRIVVSTGIDRRTSGLFQFTVAPR